MPTDPKPQTLAELALELVDKYAEEAKTAIYEYPQEMGEAHAQAVLDAECAAYRERIHALEAKEYSQVAIAAMLLLAVKRNNALPVVDTDPQIVPMEVTSDWFGARLNFLTACGLESPDAD